MSILVSFIICALNEEAYIGDAIRSIKLEMSQYILERPSSMYEIIVVDNGSTDNTWLKASQEGVRMIEEPKKGISHARLAGFQASQGRYCAFLDADGRLPPGWWKSAALGLCNPNVVAVSGSLYFYDGPRYLNRGTKLFYKVAKFFHNIWHTIQGGNWIAKREAIEQANPWDPNLPYWGEDTYSATQLAKIGRIKLDPKMVMNTSARRLVQDGVIKTVGLYILNYLSVNILHTPVTKKYDNFR